MCELAAQTARVVCHVFVTLHSASSTCCPPTRWWCLQGVAFLASSLRVVNEHLTSLDLGFNEIRVSWLESQPSRQM